MENFILGWISGSFAIAIGTASLILITETANYIRRKSKLEGLKAEIDKQILELYEERRKQNEHNIH